MRVILVRLAGGLGNQLFQLAAAVAIRARFGTGAIHLDLAGLTRYSVPREYSLPRVLRLPAWITTQRPPGTTVAIAARLLRWRAARFPLPGCINDRSFQSDVARGRADRLMHPILMDGYFQQGWMQAPFDAALAEIASWSTGVAPGDATGEGECVVHVRGGDFLASAQHQVVDESFYLNACRILRSRDVPLRLIRVVTDDPAFAARMLKPVQLALPSVPVVIPERPSDDWLEDFERVRAAGSRIIGNSTFSWWASALDPRRAPTVSPTQWTRGFDRELRLPWETAIRA